MNPQVAQSSPHSGAWIAFTYASFAGAVGMVGIGILFAPVEIWVKAYFAMGAALLVQSSITMTKTLRDVHEGGKLVNRIEDARAERLLMEIERGKE
ncbi:MAG TPA: YiaA/YiaB family inner membrane protein [Xanthobacteraceae bacterium]|nr:YiaA/YiaB family inner membrane protein [Xanthobacteraceae bacterium]